MAHGHENLIPFSNRSRDEARKYGAAGGKASCEARRRKADFRRTRNLLLTTRIDSEEWTPLLEAMGLESTLESAANMAMIKEALSGNVKAYEAVARYAGQTDRTEADEAEQKVRTEAARARYGQEDEEADSGVPGEGEKPAEDSAGYQTA